MTNNELIYSPIFKQSKCGGAAQLTPRNVECKHDKKPHRAREVGGVIRCSGCDNMCVCPEGIEHDQEIRIKQHGKL